MRLAVASIPSLASKHGSCVYSCVIHCQFLPVIITIPAKRFGVFVARIQQRLRVHLSNADCTYGKTKYVNT